MELADASVSELREFGGEIFADSRNLKPIRRRERRDGIRQVNDRVSGVAVRTDFERVLVLDFEQIANLVEDTGDGEVVHEAISEPPSAGRLRIQLR
jgi:hypothetical protein